MFWPYGGMPMYVAPQQQQQPMTGGIVFNNIKELKDFLKSVNKEGKKNKKEEPKLDDGFITIKKPKPKTYTVAQLMLLLTFAFPLVGPIYYFAVLGSWELLKAGMANMLH
jgi:hypothetical protein